MIENPNVICNECGFCKQNKELEDKCERLEKQLKIAVEALDSLRGICYPQVAEKALTKIKEVK